MNYFYLVSGIVILSVVYYEISYTILAMTGAGKLTGRFTWLIWQIFLQIAGKDGRSRIFKYSGMVTIYSILIAWVVLIWAGNTLILASDGDSVINEATKNSATFIEKIYFTGYTLSTLGYGDFLPNSNFWKIYSVIISFTGLILITTCITYVIPVLSDVIKKRQLSILISTIGETPVDMLLKNWNGRNFNNLEKYFKDISTLLIAHAQSHHAYPILHYFHSNSMKESSSIMIPVLDEALTILLVSIPKENRPSKESIFTLRRSITVYLYTLSLAYIKSSKVSPEIPCLDELKVCNIDFISGSESVGLYNKLSKRRKLLDALVINDGWAWKDLYESKAGMELDLE